MSDKSLHFAVFCIGIVAEYLGMNAKDVYHLMQKGDVIDGYIVSCYDSLHTFSREYITEDLVGLMRLKGLIAA